MKKKTKLIEFGRFAHLNRKARGAPKPEGFNFLGFTHLCGVTRETGRFKLMRFSIKNKLRLFLHKVKARLKETRNKSPYDVGRWLKRVLNGYFNYFAVPGNRRSISLIRTEVCRYWLK